MTFEELLIKKKIDAFQLKAKESAFFSEFESHFLQMGEKSFDYSKKFWFNKLRRAYPLKEEPKPVKEEVGTSAIVQEKSTTQDINQEKPAYAPRFKAVIPQKEDLLVQKTESNPSAANVPRFKATIKVQEKAEDTGLNKEPESEVKSKPVYKPRFKPGITKKDTSSE